MINGRRDLNVLVVTIIPHPFHWPMYTRLADGRNVVMVAPGAQIGRHDNPYMADAMERHAKTTLELEQHRTKQRAKQLGVTL